MRKSNNVICLVCWFFVKLSTSCCWLTPSFQLEFFWNISVPLSLLNSSMSSFIVKAVSASPLKVSSNNEDIEEEEHFAMGIGSDEEDVDELVEEGEEDEMNDVKIAPQGWRPEPGAKVRH